MINAETGDIAKTLNVQNVTAHLRTIASLISAKIIIEPQVKYCDSPGNTGYISIVGIGTSHISCHHWDQTNPQRLQMDVYSCTQFDEDVALKEICSFWKLKQGRFWVVRRRELLQFEIEREGLVPN